MKESSKLVPEIRFSGFTDAWEQRKLGEVFNFPISTNSLSRSQLNYIDGEVKSIHYGDILINYNSILDIKKHTVPFITEGKLEKYKENLLENGDIIFADAAEDETVGKAVEIVGIAYESIVSGLHTIVARPKEKMAIFFGGYYINSNAFHRQLLRLIQGTKVSSISKTNLQKTVMSYPSKIEEQTKIGAFFKQLDDIIALNNRKYDALKQLKSGYIAQIFSQNLRFSGFLEDWEVRSLGELACITTGKLDANAMVQYGKYKFFTSGIKTYRIDDFAFKGPAITIAGNGATVGYMHLADDKFNAYQRTYVLNDFKAERQFLFSQVGILLPKKIAKEARTGNIPYIVMDMLTELKLTIPKDIKEQIKIGSFVEQLDLRIFQQETKIQALKKLKQTYLQKLFI